MASRLTDEGNAYCSNDFVDQEVRSKRKNGEWRLAVENDCGFVSIPRVGSKNYSKDVKIVRDSFCEYFNSNEVQSPWQRDMVFTLLTPKD